MRTSEAPPEKPTPAARCVGQERQRKAQSMQLRSPDRGSASVAEQEKQGEHSHVEGEPLSAQPLLLLPCCRPLPLPAPPRLAAPPLPRAGLSS